METNNSLIGTKIKSKPKEKEEIGIDTNNTLATDLLEAAEYSSLDTSILENFNNVAQTREQIYQLIDAMASDSTIAAILETYAEDACETNDAGQIVWAESSDDDVVQYVTFLLDSMNVDKHIYNWVYNLIKYGDVYLRLFKNGEYGEDVLFSNINESRTLNEDVILSLQNKDDHYVNYVEAIKNPGEMFELTRFGKTMGYIQAPVMVQNIYNYDNQIMSTLNNFAQYKMKKNDVTVYQATSFVHAAMEDNSSRTAEEVDIYTTEADYDSETNSVTYNVKRGQSLLYNVYKIWRQWKLLENSIMLNRITKSSIVRILEVEVGDMPKEAIRNTLRNIKQMVEQKTAIETDSAMGEYNNPGAVENTIYIPTKGEIGKINTQELGAESSDPKSLADLEYFRDLFFAAMRVPKQFFGFTDDSTGFNGGTALSIISSRYGKAVKRIQNTILQALTDAINIMLLDRGLNSYVNKFTLRMQAPLTQEILDRREDQAKEFSAIKDLTDTVGANVDDSVMKLKILKELLSTSTQNPNIISLIQEAIDKIEKNNKEDNNMEENQVEEETSVEETNEEETTTEEEEKPTLTPLEPEEETMGESFQEALNIDNDENYLPSFAELGIKNGSDSTKF